MWRRAAELPRGAARQLLGLASYAPQNSKLLPGHRIRLLIDGAEAYPRMLDAIARARDYVHLETYIWEPDRIGRRFADALRAKAREGVKVRVIYDSFGSSNLSWDFVEELKDARVEVLEFRPLRLLSANWDKMSRLRRRDHRKLLIVDGRISFCGGLNIGDSYMPLSDGGGGWRDTHIQIRGPVTAQLEALFRETWNEHGASPYRPYPEVSLDAVADEAILANALVSDEAGQRTTIRRHYLHAIERAQRTIYIANAYFVPSRTFLRALKRAAERGVEVRLLLPSLAHNDVKTVQLASQHSYAGLLEAGVRIHAWPISHMHSKTAVIDGRWSIVGSYNLDAVSLFQSLEVVVEILGESFGAEMVRMFERDFDRSVELDVQTWEARTRLEKLAEPVLFRLRRFL